MGSDDLSAIRAQGFTHLEGWCAACRVVKVMPLETLEGLAPGLGLRAIAPRLTCRACRGPVTEVKPLPSRPGQLCRQAVGRAVLRLRKPVALGACRFRGDRLRLLVRLLGRVIGLKTRCDQSEKSHEEG